jgi:diadenosine tetraphosphate (Ap4A) HIT family hydrolase
MVPTKRQANAAKNEGPMTYDPNNIFARIIRGEIPSAKVYEDDWVLAFRDIRPQVKVHVLIIPKGPYLSMEEFSAKASDAEILAFHRAIAKVTKIAGIDITGYRLIANTGADGHQEVPHFHLHILGGQPVGRMVSLPG